MTDHPFVDVTKPWQQAPVAWAYAAGVTTGTSPTTFEPDRPITRAEAIAFLHRALGQPDPPAPVDDQVEPGEWTTPFELEQKRGGFEHLDDGSVRCVVGLPGDEDTSFARIRATDVGELGAVHLSTIVTLPEGFYDAQQGDLRLLTTDNFGMSGVSDELRFGVLLAVDGTTRVMVRHKNHEEHHQYPIVVDRLPEGQRITIELEVTQTTVTLTIDGTVFDAVFVFPESVPAEQRRIDNVAGGIDGASNQRAPLAVIVHDFDWHPVDVTPAPNPDPAPPADDGRAVVYVTEQSGRFEASENNTIYDFEGHGCPEIIITATSNCEVRNVAGGGARRIGARDGKTRTDVGFRDCEGTFFNHWMSDGADIIRPFFVGMVDVNPQPNVSNGDVMQVFAYEGDIVNPLIEDCVLKGKRRPEGSTAHNDGIQFTGIGGGKVHNPTVRGGLVDGASSAAIQAKHVVGLFTIDGTILTERFGSFHAVIAKPGAEGATVLWRGVLEDGASAAFTGGWSRHPDSIDDPGLTIT